MGPIRARRFTPGPHVESATGRVMFVLDQAQDHRRPVSVWFHLRDFGADTRFRRRGRQWVARIPRPPVDRMEYLVVLRDQHGNEAMVPDPANPRRARSVFGDHSLIEFPGYRRPTWLDHPPAGGTALPVRFDSAEDPGVSVSGSLWTPRGSTDTDPLPLLVVHDGPEYADLAGLLRYVGWLGNRDPAHPFRVLLLQPEDRNRIYSASPAYSRLLMDTALPQITGQHVTSRPPIGLGASLGALALVHAAVHRPGVFGGLMLQSGSFFRTVYDPQERRFRYYDRIVRFMQELADRPQALAGPALALTCGSGEENLLNNRALVRRLREAGLDPQFTENADGHNYTGWRDCLDPALGRLIDQVWWPR